MSDHITKMVRLLKRLVKNSEYSLSQKTVQRDVQYLKEVYQAGSHRV